MISRHPELDDGEFVLGDVRGEVRYGGGAKGVPEDQPTRRDEQIRWAASRKGVVGCVRCGPVEISE